LCPRLTSFEPDDGRAPAAFIGVGRFIRRDLGHPRERRADDARQRAGPLPVDDANPEDASSGALPEVFGDQVLHLRGFERVQVQRPFDGDLDRAVVLFYQASLTTFQLARVLSPKKTKSSYRVFPILIIPPGQERRIRTMCGMRGQDNALPMKPLNRMSQRGPVSLP